MRIMEAGGRLLKHQSQSVCYSKLHTYNPGHEPSLQAQCGALPMPSRLEARGLGQVQGTHALIRQCSSNAAKARRHPSRGGTSQSDIVTVWRVSVGAPDSRRHRVRVAHGERARNMHLRRRHGQGVERVRYGEDASTAKVSNAGIE